MSEAQRNVHDIKKTEVMLRSKWKTEFESLCALIEYYAAPVQHNSSKSKNEANKVCLDNTADNFVHTWSE